MRIYKRNGKLVTPEYWICDCPDGENIMCASGKSFCPHCLANEINHFDAPIISVIEKGYPISDITDFDGFCLAFDIHGLWNVRLYHTVQAFVADDPSKYTPKNFYACWIQVLDHALNHELSPIGEWLGPLLNKQYPAISPIPGPAPTEPAEISSIEMNLDETMITDSSIDAINNSMNIAIVSRNPTITYNFAGPLWRDEFIAHIDYFENGDAVTVPSKEAAAQARASLRAIRPDIGVSVLVFEPVDPE